MLGLEKALDVITGPAIEFVKDKLKYIWNYKNYVRNLEGEFKHLEDVKEQVNHEIEEGEDNLGNIEKEVTEWLKQVDEVTKEARGVQQKKKMKSCFRETIFNPYTRYKIGKEAEELTQSIQQLETKKNGFRRIYFRSAPGKVTGSYKGISYYDPPSRDAILKDINKALVYSDVKMVGVFGPSGVGKSTLLMRVMEQVHRRMFNYDFDEVAMASVTQDPDLEKIQRELAYSLNLTFENEINVDQKKQRLRNRLSQGKKILIILDDIWKELDLKKIGIPIEVSNVSIKLLLTSRLEETLEHKMDCGHNFELKAFSKEEAVELFKRIVGCQIEDESLMELIDREIVKECACLPVYIVPLATQLKTYAPSTWKKALDDLRESNKLGMNKLLEETLKDEEAKRLFLLCGQIGTQIIPIEDLLVYGMGLGLFQCINTIEEKREKLKTLLESLKSICFLEDYRNDYIKIHDVMSEASFSVASKSQYSLVLRNGKQLQGHLKNGDALDKCKSISLPFVDDITGELPKDLKCPELNMFLSYNVEGFRFPDSFFNKMKELKVLDIFGAFFSVLPSSIQCIKKLQTLCLDHCKIHDLSMLGQLKELQVLILRKCLMPLLPKEIGELIELRLLDLSGCIHLPLIEHGVLKSLTKLEELYLPENYTNWEVEGFRRASLEELTCMSSLTSLTICIPNLTRLPHDFPFAKLKRYKIVIMELDTVYSRNEESRNKESGERISSKYSSTESEVKATNCFIEYDKMGTLRIKLDSSNREIFLEDWVQTTLRSAQRLELLGWTGYEESITELSKQGFSDLKHISVQNSPGIQYVFRPKDRFSSALLESLHLEKLINLKMIYQGNLLTNSFINLRILRIKACYKLQCLFSPSLAKGLSRLEEIELSDCKRLTKIVASNETGHMEGKGGGNNEYEKLIFKGLRRLVLSGLPQISSFSAKEDIRRGDSEVPDDTSLVAFLDGRQVSFPSLEYLALSELPKLSKISEDKFPVKLQGVRILKIESCENLANISESNLPLGNLEALTIKKCCSIKAIFNLEKKSCQGKAFSNNNLAKLMKLKLIELESLETIWPRNINIKEGSLVQNLKQLEVSQCQKLNHLFSSSMIKSLQNISHISVDKCKDMKVIFVEENSTQNIGDTIRFSSLIELRISNMDCLTMFASGNHSFDFPCLRKLEIYCCPKMSTFVPQQDERKSPTSDNNTLEFGDEPSSCIKQGPSSQERER